MKSLVSIVIPVYNAEKYLSECLESVIGQTYKDIEILLINDGSTDKSGEICEQYAKKDARVKVVNKKNEGVSAARNDGIELAKGEYISFIDSDDVVDENYILSMYQKSEETGADLTLCRYSNLIDGRFFDVAEDLPEVLDVDLNNGEFVNFVCRLLDYKSLVFGSSCRTLFKKSVVKQTRFNTSIKISEDLLFLLSITLQSKRIASVNEHLYFYRQTNSSVTASYKKGYLSGQIILYEELKKKFDLFNSKISKKVFNIYSCLLCYYTLSNELKFKQPNRKENVKEIRGSVLYKYFNVKNGLRFRGAKRKLKFLTVWFLTKFRVI